MNKIKVAIYSGDIPSSTFIERLILGLPTEKYEILLFGNQLKKVVYPGNIKLYPVPAGQLQAFLYVVVNTIRLFVTKPADAAKLISVVSNYKGWRFRYLLKLLPIVMHRPDIFHIQWVKSIQDLLILKTVFNIRLCISLRGSHINYSPVLDRSLASVYMKSFNKVDAFHAVSKAIKDKSQAYGAPADKISVIHSGLNEKLYSSDINYEKYNNKELLQIIAVGRNHWVKGYCYLIDALAICKSKNIPFHFTLIGGAVNEDLKFQIHQQNLNDNITIIDSLSNKEVLNKVRDAHVLICSSVDEGISNAVLEAMAIGTVAISTDCGGMPEVIKDNINGFIVPKRDSSKLFEAICAVRNKNFEEVCAMVQNARNTIIQDFNETNMVSDFDELYRSLYSLT